MAEVTRRSFDLKSWQGLTLVLKVARESELAPSAYAEFRNLVLEYAQQKGTDAELKKKIDAVIATFDTDEKKVVAIQKPPQIEQREAVERLGRRVVPTFVHRSSPVVLDSEIPTPIQTSEPVSQLEPTPVIPEPVLPPPSELVIPTVTETPLPVVLPPTERTQDVPPQHAGLKSVEEHRTRILEIKRQVNSQIENPIALVDHGNPLGREYMSALLSALKATNPGATYNLEGAMETLEDVFGRVLEHASHPHEESDSGNSAASAASIVPPIPSPLPEPASVPVNEVPVTNEEAIPPPPPVAPEETGRSAVPEGGERWAEAGGDVDLKDQIQELRKQLGAVDAPTRTTRRSLIPSIMDMDEASISERHTSSVPPNSMNANDIDELTPAKLTQRPDSSLTGITLDTPQAELVSPEVTMALTELLHEWKIFASSGIFGMGPGGIEHPLYIQISKLPMGEVLAGRFENADMKIAHSIKDYVDAWRHEQAVAYLPTETFEHYLRRVAQRIMKRQKGDL